jgi:hypothetical protein
MKSIDWQGQQIYRATKVGEELKFAGKGRGLSEKLRVTWKDCIKDIHYFYAEGDDLVLIKKLDPTIFNSTNKLLMLSEEGYKLVEKKVKESKKFKVPSITVREETIPLLGSPQQIIILNIKNKYYWIAGEIGYLFNCDNEGKALVDCISKKEEDFGILKKDLDYVILQTEEVAALKTNPTFYTAALYSPYIKKIFEENMTNVMILSASGLQLTLQKIEEKTAFEKKLIQDKEILMLDSLITKSVNLWEFLLKNSYC